MGVGSGAFFPGCPPSPFYVIESETIAMKPIENVKLKTARSNEMLEQARRFIEQAKKLPEGDDKRKWLEEEAQRLINEARELTESAKQQAVKYKS